MNIYKTVHYDISSLDEFVFDFEMMSFKVYQIWGEYLGTCKHEGRIVERDGRIVAEIPSEGREVLCVNNVDFQRHLSNAYKLYVEYTLEMCLLAEESDDE